jgi:hypothetical protein
MVKEVRARAKGTCWKCTQGWLFCDDAGWFVEARHTMWITEKKSTFQLYCKPMGVDPVFWAMVDAEENLRQPLSFRMLGAWTVTTPALHERELVEPSETPREIAEAILEAAASELQRARIYRSGEDFLRRVQERHDALPTCPYLPALTCSMVLLDRREDARQLCLAARERHHGGGFLANSKTFVDLALEWLDRTQPLRH